MADADGVATAAHELGRGGLVATPGGLDSLSPASVLETTSGEKVAAGVTLAGKIVVLYFRCTLHDTARTHARTQ